MKSTKPIIMTAHVRTKDKQMTIEFTKNRPKMVIKVKPTLSYKK